MTYKEGIRREQEIYQEETEQFKRLAELGAILDQPIICPKWNIKVLRPNGDIRIERKSFNHSWTRNGFNIHTQIAAFGSTAGTNTYVDGGIGLKHTSSAVGLAFLNTLALEVSGYNGGEGVLTHGIIIGTGNTAEALNDFTIETLIDDGNAVGEMEYGFSTKVIDAWDAGNSRWESQWERFFDNLSGNLITVNEFALYHQLSPSGFYCLIRDVISPGQAIADDERLVINQEFRVIIP